ncbi:universal stress protein [Oceanicella actignis]|uniref:Nucleotide-binding universal stress protein, UspA family n=1 Tax=Oceanicella actignis TaxID=1189325 RepID=A0A1M7SBG5_9RHOB|nr:universal stress protein [Oceanicella actignis]TYO91516.1 nucleotide-binding universal stress UspA family protein [Oceanicella actignis]SET27445.1 Nucleotide-binding universal stress protein, UspA family [Oceanicella actignis]SHN55795.1 Nucleotide-binding universal stress protein, UspA family [Oceanicella actignis]
MYKNILIPVALDHDDAARASLEVARALAAEGARLTVIHVIEETPSYVAAYIPEETLRHNREEARRHVAALAEGVGAAHEVVSGHAARTIVRYAEDHGADCIVLASHKPGLEDYFLGSTAAHVVRHARCSVHVMR